ncbi:MAG: Holliday junction branch migration protein RuvA [Candidatus Zambryskibacteria bacterium]|nr:Holliday junction branch migration protein RuvA [Candidatus Zambryskibacteria bacterium]
MFGHISGKIFSLKGTRAIVKAGGIGFVINSTPAFLSKLKIGQEGSFWVHTAVRENSIDLYGFENENELRIFEHLITVSGVGPKSGLAILSIAGPKAIEEAVASGDTSSLTKISGIGKKTAEKIVLELNGKLAAIEKGNIRASEDVDVFEALKTLGYKEREIQEIIKNLPEDLKGANEKIKYALKNITNNQK